MKEIKTEIIVVAAGQGQRMGGEGNKLFLPLAGKPILHHALANLARCPLVGALHLVVRPGEEALMHSMLQQYGEIPKLKSIIFGGAERADSVRNGLQQVLRAGESGVVMVHDGARPFVSSALITRLFHAAFEGSCAIPVIPVADTTRQIVGDQVQIIDRASLRLTQTPQAFPLAWVEEVFFSEAAKNKNLTDEAAYFEAAGYPLALVEGDPQNKKITTPPDLAWAEAIYPLFANE